MSATATSPNKRRAGERMGGALVADPRPQVRNDTVLGVRCAACGYPSAPPAPWCPACQHGEQHPAAFGPLGTVWSSTRVQIPVGRWTPPYVLAYVDFDEGPRLLVHVDTPQALRAGTRVCITGADEGGDVMVRVERAA